MQDHGLHASKQALPITKLTFYKDFGNRKSYRNLAQGLICDTMGVV